MSLLRRIDKGSGNTGGDSGSGGRGPEPAGGAAGGETEESKLASMRQRRQALAEQQRPGAPGKGNNYIDLKTRVQNKLVSELDHSQVDTTRKNEVRTHIEELFNAILADESIVISRAERLSLFEAIVAEILGFGPLEILLADDTITEIMVNGPKNVFIEQKGNITRANVSFESDEHVMRIIDRI